MQDRQSRRSCSKCPKSDMSVMPAMDWPSKRGTDVIVPSFQMKTNDILHKNTKEIVNVYVY